MKDNPGFTNTLDESMTGRFSFDDTPGRGASGDDHGMD
jgi:hypothetical protein